MLSYGKTSGVAVAVTSLLAQRYGKGVTGSREIARERGFAAAQVAKVLTQLADAGLVEGRRGPGGGYRLARAPATISVADVIAPFEGARARILCPFGSNWCGKHAPCPLHDRMAELHAHNEAALRGMTLEVFCSPP